MRQNVFDVIRPASKFSFMLVTPQSRPVYKNKEQRGEEKDYLSHKKFASKKTTMRYVS